MSVLWRHPVDGEFEQNCVNACECIVIPHAFTLSFESSLQMFLSDWSQID